MKIMNLLDIAQKNGRTYRKVSSIHGGEYHGPCPTCTGTDRFHIWPDQGDYGTFWCRGCGLAGDAIEYLTKIEGMTFPAACKELGKELAEMEEYQAPKFKRPAAAGSFSPREITAPADLWIEHAEKFVEACHQQLLDLGEGEGTPLAYLLSRGITKETAIKFRLGWNQGEKGKAIYKAREAWGLETVMSGDKKKKLWLPIGLVIPFYLDSILRRVRIRIPVEHRTAEFSLSYYLVPGSSMDTFIINPAAKAFVIIEAELDAILVDQLAGDLTGTMAMGNSTAKPTSAAFALLSDCLHISNALDYDARTSAEGKYENPGGVGWLWWKKHFAQAERWPVPVGKDPGDAFKDGIDLRAWITAGLPPVLTLPPVSAVLVKSASPAPYQDNSGAVVSAAPAEPERQFAVTMRTSKDGRIYHITNNPAEYARLVAAGEIVFDFAEMALVIKSGANQQEAVNFLVAKQTFPGIRLTEVESINEDQESDRPQYRGKYTAQQETP
jgi:DNA primase